MDIKELNSFNLSDAIKFHTELNPKLWHNSKLDPLVKKQLLIIAADFMDELGIYDIDVEDIRVSGSNAAFTYTPHSDIDLHILVDMSKLPNDEVYRELFQAKKTLYNDSHDITIHGVPVELYVQDTNQPHVSLGEYSVLNDRWIKIPKKRKATLDQAATKAKYDTLSDLIKLAMKTHDSNRVRSVLKMINRYRKAGLSKGGEFSPENLAFKIIRTQGAIDALYALRDKLHSEELTIEEKQVDTTPVQPTMESDHLAERLSKEFEDYDLTEYRSQEIIHANPKINTLKSLARNNKHGSARFTIDKDGYLKAGDSVAFVHQDLEPAYGRVIIRGYINFHDGNYNYRTMGPHDNLPKDHPILRKFEKAGIENSNIDTNLNEALDRDGAIQQILKLKNTSGRTQGEIESATNIINKLMQKFNIRPEEIDKPKVTKLAKKIAATQHEKQAASDALKAEWERFKSRFFTEDAKLDEAYTTKQQVIGHFAREARKRGKNVNLAMKQGAEAWERGWRGPEPKELKKPKEIKPYDPERYKNVRLPYRDDDDDDTNEDYDPNGPPPGPEFKPTMPAGTVKVDVSDVYDWYKLGQHVSNLKGLGKHDFGQGPPSTILSFGDEDTEHKYIQDLEKTGLTTTDIDPVDPNQPKGMKCQKTDPTYNVNETPIKLYTDPNYFGADVDDTNLRNLPVKNIPINQLVGYEPDSKMDGEDAKANVKKIVAALMKGKKVPPILVRKWKNGYQVVDGHHRFYAYKLLKKDTIPSQVVPDEDIETVNETEDRKAAVLRIQKHLNKKYGANLDLDGKLGPLTRKSINKFMPRAKAGLADEPDKTTAVQGKKLKETESKPTTTINFRTWQKGGVPRHSFVVVRDGKEIAGGEISKDNEWDDDRGASVQDIVVHPDYRRKGFATKIYNEIERKFNYKLHPSDDVKPDGQEFWKARSNLDEALDSKPYPYQQIKLSDTLVRYKFETEKGLSYHVSIGIASHSINVAFSLMHYVPAWDRHVPEMDITYTGDARRVFATVIDIVKKYVVANKPERIKFTATETSRRRLYDAFIKRVDREMPDYVAVAEMPGWYVLERKPKKIDEASDYSQYEDEIEDFVQSLNPDDVGVEEIGPYHVHFEGFTDECQQDAERRCNLPSDNLRHLASYDDVYKEVIRDFVRREGGKKPLKVGFAGYEDYPVIYAVFDNPEPYKNPDAWNPKIDEASGYIPSAKEKNDPVISLIDQAKAKLGEDALYGGNCGMFALALASKLKEQGIPVTLGLMFNDANDLHFPSDIIDNEADLYHVVIEYNGKYYDGTGIVTPDTLLDIAYDQYGDDAPGWFTDADPSDPKVQQVIRSETNWNKPEAAFYQVLSEASGYIPSAKEKNDPRFKTALTVDVKPDAIKKNAKAFGFKTSRAGIPPQARADGKIK